MSLLRTPFGTREADLLNRAQEGDRSAWNDLVICYLPEIQRVCFFVLRHHQDAEDACNQTFLKAQLALARFKSGSFGAWLTTIARNTCADELRRRRRRESAIQLVGGAQESLKLLDFLCRDVAVDGFREEECKREGRGLADVVANVLATLTPQEKAVMQAYYGEEAALHTIADRYHTSEWRVRRVRARALRKLRHPSRSRQLRDYLE